MLTMFTIDDQVFERVGDETRPTTNARTVRVGLWLSACPDCGASFKQGHRDRGFEPSRFALRRCPPCRKGPGRPITRPSGNGKAPPAPPASALPLSWQAPRPGSVGQDAAGTANQPAKISGSTGVAPPPRAIAVQPAGKPHARASLHGVYFND